MDQWIGSRLSRTPMGQGPANFCFLLFLKNKKAKDCKHKKSLHGLEQEGPEQAPAPNGLWLTTLERDGEEGPCGCETAEALFDGELIVRSPAWISTFARLNSKFQC